jgi:dolichyl-phosphate beta-glucosyltransferase
LIKTLDAIAACSGSHNHSWQVIISDDGSATPPDPRGLAERLPTIDLTVMACPTHRGKGAALRRGVAATDGRLVLLTDADLSTPMSELDKLAGALEQNDIAIGSRDLPDSTLDPPQSVWRRIGSRGLRAARRRLILPDLCDTQCGFKLFRGDIARELFADSIVDRFAIDIEVLALACQRGYRVAEVGVVWRNDPDSRVRPIRDAIAMLGDIGRVRRRLRRTAQPG